MPNIIFRKNFEVKKELVEEDLIKKFPFANEFYTAIKIQDDEFSEGFIESLIKKKDIFKEYKKLEKEEKNSAKELLTSIYYLTPEFFNKEMREIIEIENLHELEEIKIIREEILEKTIYLSICERDKFFLRIVDGELIKLNQEFLVNKEQEIIK